MILAFILVQERFMTWKIFVRLGPPIKLVPSEFYPMLDSVLSNHNFVKIISGLKIWPSKEFGSGLNIKYSVISNTEPADDKFVFQLDIENDSLNPLEFETDENAWEIHFRLVITNLYSKSTVKFTEHAT